MKYINVFRMYFGSQFTVHHSYGNSMATKIRKNSLDKHEAAVAGKFQPKKNFCEQENHFLVRPFENKKFYSLLLIILDKMDKILKEQINKLRKVSLDSLEEQKSKSRKVSLDDGLEEQKSKLRKVSLEEQKCKFRKVSLEEQKSELRKGSLDKSGLDFSDFGRRHSYDPFSESKRKVTPKEVKCFNFSYLISILLHSVILKYIPKFILEKARKTLIFLLGFLH